MDVIRFLFVSLGSSTVQPHDTLGRRRACASSEPGLSSPNGDRAWRVYYWRAAFSCAFLWAKGLNAKDIHKKSLLFRVGSVCRVRKFTTESRNSIKDVRKPEIRKRRCGSGWDNSQNTSMLQISTHWESDGTSVSMLVERMSRNECFFLPDSNVKCFTFYIHLWPIYWLSLVLAKHTS
jgi:hypothetical protein